jgi:hypothetical protein
VSAMKCPCGLDLHYTSAAAQASVERLVDALGPEITVTTSAGSWLVPRHFIALHGIVAAELPALATRFRFTKIKAKSV